MCYNSSMTDYTTLTTAKRQLEIDLDVDDTALSTLITAASRLIDKYCGREENFFVALTSATAREYSGTGKTYVFVDPYVEVTKVEVKDSATDDTYTEWTSSDYWEFSGSPEFPDFDSLPYTGLMIDPNGDYNSFTSGKYSTARGFRPTVPIARAVKTVKVTAKWGYASEAPELVEEACIMLVGRWWSRLKASMSDTLTSGELGRMVYTKRMDPDVAAILDDGRLRAPAVGMLP